MNKPEDNENWLEIIKDIKPIPQKKFIKKKVQLKEVEPSISYTQVYQGETLEDLNVGTIANIDKNTARKFKRGEFVIERRIDLHGYTEDNAYETVMSFVKQSYLNKLRCILIVTGKGEVLKQRLPQWLNTKELRPLILSYDYALPKDGGSGALYVLLRRHRD